MHNTSCDAYFLAKHNSPPFPNSTSHASNCFDLIHMDIWGPYSTPSLFGHKYFLTIVADHSIFCWIYLMRLKSETMHFVKTFINIIQTQFHKIAKTIRTNNGHEFSLKYFYASKDIQHQTSCVDTPQQNEIVESKHQHLLNVAQALLFTHIFPKHFGPMPPIMLFT